MATLTSRTFEDVFASGRAPLAVISRDKGEATARAVVVALMAEVLEFFSLRDEMGMSERQIVMTCDMILEEFYYLQPDDIRLCFRNGMKMRYGRLYGRIDGHTFFEWLRRYSEERMDAADEQSYNTHRMALSGADNGEAYREYESRKAEIEAKKEKQTELEKEEK